MKRTNIKIHASIDDKTADLMTEFATAVGLDSLDYDANYRMYKIGSKIDNDISLSEKRFVASGFIRLVGGVNHVSVYISSVREWFRTSPIVSCKKKNDKVIIETRNSFYELTGE
jgi:hypothetical protein